MRLRRHGHPDDLAHACHLLATVLDVAQVSRLYPDRAPSPHARRYLDADLPTPPRPPSTPDPAPGAAARAGGATPIRPATGPPPDDHRRTRPPRRYAHQHQAVTAT